MPPFCSTQSIHAHSAFVSNLSHIAGIHSGHLPHHYTHPQPYTRHMSASNRKFPQGDYELLPGIGLPSRIQDKINYTQNAAVNISTQRKDAS